MSNLYPLLHDLQYKMFLLNEELREKGFLTQQFTIQNVPIKYLQLQLS